MNNLVVSAFAAFSCGLATISSAPTMAQQYAPALYGPGSVRGGCGEWASAADAGIDMAYGSWVLGYLSAVNVWGMPAVTNVTGGTLNFSVVDWVKNWCRAHPLNQVADGAMAVISELIAHHGAKRLQ